jgi:hypothetical protein
MFSLKQLLQYTKLHRPSILDKAKSIAVKFKSVKKQTDAEGDEFVEIFAIARGDTIPRNVEIGVWGKGPSAKVWVSCDCEYFMYHTEYVLDKRGNTDRQYAINRAPKITNPRMVSHVCKHIAACFYRGAADLTPEKFKKK